MNETQGERLFKMAIQKRHAGELKEALEYLEELLSMPESDRRHAFMEKSHILYSLGYYEKCIACIDQCRLIISIDLNTYSPDLPRGSAWIDRANSYSDIDPEALFLKSLALDRLGKSKEAKICRTKSAAAAEELSPSGQACDWWALYSSVYSDMGWKERGIFYQDAQLQIDPGNLNALHGKACRSSNRGEHTEPLPLFDKAMQRGTVDRADELIAISYGEKNIPVALIAKDEKGQLVVQFLLSETTDDPEIRKILKSVYRDLDFYLVRKNARDPWAYAIYHCGTAANRYLKVHWSYQCKP